MPSAYDYLFKNEKFNWCYAGEPEPALGGRQLYQPRGKVLGGSSSINGLGFIRGHPLDFERWAAEGRRAGPIARCFPTSAGLRAGTVGPTPIAVVMGRSG